MPRHAPSPLELGDTEDATIAFRPWAIVLAAVAAIVVGMVPIPDLTPAAHRTLIILTVVVVLWFTEALPVVVPALLVPVLALLLGVTDAKGAFAGFADPVVFLFFGTFLLTEAAARHGMNARLARSVLGSRWVRARPGNLLIAIALLGCFISAWVNNTATTALLLPLALTAERFGDRKLLVGTLLMASYGPSLGGCATPVGTAPNLIGLRLLEQATGQRPSFAHWCLVFAPLALLFTLASAWWVGRGVRANAAPPEPARSSAPEAAQLDVARACGSLTNAPSPAWSLAERLLLPLFFGVILLWIGPGLLQATPLRGSAALDAFRARVPEAAVPLLGALLLFVLPSRGGRELMSGPRILDVGVFRRVDWSTLLLFGGGLSLGAMMFDSGLATWIGHAVSGVMRVQGSPFGGTFGLVFVATLLAVLVSEITSNTASAALVVPVVLALAQAAGVDPVKPALAATIGCSFGFMLPVSTPPNALVYGTGRIRIGEMISNGLLLDVVGVLVVSGWVTLFG